MSSSCGNLIVLSPHRDDAAFSTGLLLYACARAGLQAAVVNIFTRSEYAPYLQAAGLEQVSAVREQEDVAFFGSLPGPVVFGDLEMLDAPVRRRIAVEEVLLSSLADTDFEADVAAVSQGLSVLPDFDVLIAPLGLGGHLDHIVTREAARRLVPSDKLGYYADLPYATRMESVEAPLGLKEYRLLVEGGAARKERMAGLYSSQIVPDLAREIADFCAQGERLFLPEVRVNSLRRALGEHAVLR